jgi:hypothetical protein
MRAHAFAPAGSATIMGSTRMRWLLLLSTIALSGCGVVAAPCRVGSAALDMLPLIGHVAAAPTDACAEAIDPG